MVVIFSYMDKDLFYQFLLKVSSFTDYSVVLQVYLFHDISNLQGKGQIWVLMISDTQEKQCNYEAAGRCRWLETQRYYCSLEKLEGYGTGCTILHLLVWGNHMLWSTSLMMMIQYLYYSHYICQSYWDFTMPTGADQWVSLKLQWQNAKNRHLRSLGACATAFTAILSCTT